MSNDNLPVALVDGELLDRSEFLDKVLCNEFFYSAIPEAMTAPPEKSHIIGYLDGAMVCRLVDWEYLLHD